VFLPTEVVFLLEKRFKVGRFRVLGKTSFDEAKNIRLFRLVLDEAISLWEWFSSMDWLWYASTGTISLPLCWWKTAGYKRAKWVWL